MHIIFFIFKIKNIHEFKRFKVDLKVFHNDLLSLVFNTSILSQTSDYKNFAEDVFLDNLFQKFNIETDMFNYSDSGEIQTNEKSLTSFFKNIFSFFITYSGTKISKILNLCVELLVELFFPDIVKSSNMISSLTNFIFKFFVYQGNFYINLFKTNENFSRKLFTFSEFYEIIIN